MPAKHHRHIALTEPLLRFIEGQVVEGRYASTSEVVRAGLRLLIEHEDAIARRAGKDDQTHG